MIKLNPDVLSGHALAKRLLDQPTHVKAVDFHMSFMSRKTVVSPGVNRDRVILRVVYAFGTMVDDQFVEDEVVHPVHIVIQPEPMTDPREVFPDVDANHPAVLNYIDRLPRSKAIEALFSAAPGKAQYFFDERHLDEYIANHEFHLKGTVV